MCVFMSAVRTIKSYGESQITAHKLSPKLSGPRIGVLFIVQEEGPLRMGDLAAKLHVAPRTVTDLVDGLERDGFLERRPDPKDRRAMLIALTASAKADFEKIRAMRHAFVDEIFGCLDDDERARLLELLTKIKDKIVEKAGPLDDSQLLCNE